MAAPSSHGTVLDVKRLILPTIAALVIALAGCTDSSSDRPAPTTTVKGVKVADDLPAACQTVADAVAGIKADAEATGPGAKVDYHADRIAELAKDVQADQPDLAKQLAELAAALSEMQTAERDQSAAPDPTGEDVTGGALVEAAQRATAANAAVVSTLSSLCPDKNLMGELGGGGGSAPAPSVPTQD